MIAMNLHVTSLSTMKRVILSDQLASSAYPLARPDTGPSVCVFGDNSEKFRKQSAQVTLVEQHASIRRRLRQGRRLDSAVFLLMNRIDAALRGI